MADMKELLKDILQSQRICKRCQKEFIANRKRQIFCSQKCQVYFWKEAHPEKRKISIKKYMDRTTKCGQLASLKEQLTQTQQALDSAVEALQECAEDLKAELDARYTIGDGNIHPAMKSRYERDMSAVYKAKAALASISNKAIED